MGEWLLCSALSEGIESGIASLPQITTYHKEKSKMGGLGLPLSLEDWGAQMC